MKQKIYNIGLISAIIVFTGTIFKMLHYPGSAWLLIAGITSLVVLFLPLALINHYNAYRNRNNRILYIVTYLSCIVVFTSMLFKRLHWPQAGILFTVALPFPYIVFLPVFLGVTSRDKNFSIYNTVFVLFLLALNSVFSGLLALNVTSERVNDSYQLSRNYINQQKGLALLEGNEKKTAVSLKIDETLKSVNECQAKVLMLDDKTLDEWKRDPGKLLRPDFRGSVANGFGKEGKMLTSRMHEDIEGLMKLLGTTPGYETVAKNAGSILDFKNNSSDETDWYTQVFNDFLAWVIIYLDGLETNLYMIKATSAEE